MNAALLLALAVFPQGPAPQAVPGAPQGVPQASPTSAASGAELPRAALAEKPAPPAAPVIDYTARFDLASYEAALGEIAAAYPDLVRVKSLGKSREGKDIWLAVVADISAGDPGRLPAALVTTSLSAPVRGPEPVLFALARLLAAARSEGALKERLREVAIYFLPALDPDAAFPRPHPASPVGPSSDAPVSDAGPPPGPAASEERGPEPRRARLDRDFPARWTPFGEGAAVHAPYPLAEPETRLFARFLVDRANLSAIVVMGENGAAGNSADPAATAVADAPSEPGSLEAFCLDVLDVAVVRPGPWSGTARPSPVGSAPEGFHAAAALVRDLAEDLPRLEASAQKVERLRPDLWVVDLAVANGGRMGSSGRSARSVEGSSVRLRTSGGRVVACAVRRAGTESFDYLRAAKSLWPLGNLGGKESLSVRLVVQADEGAAVEAVFEGPRGGRARADISLR